MNISARKKTNKAKLPNEVAQRNLLAIPPKNSSSSIQDKFGNQVKELSKKGNFLDRKFGDKFIVLHKLNGIYFAISIPKNECLPNAFDYKVFVGLLALSKNNNYKIEFNSIGEIVRKLGFSNTGSVYERIKDSLDKWSFIQFWIIEDDGKELLGYEDSMMDILYRQNKRTLHYSKIQVIFSNNFINRINSDKKISFVDYEIIKKLTTESAMVIYSYLRSFDSKLKYGYKLIRNIKKLNNDLLLVKSKRKDKQISCIKKAIELINATHGEIVYKIKMEKDNVIFTKREEIKSIKNKKNKRKIILPSGMPLSFAKQYGISIS